ncbi:YTH domain [Macleaya cordata]|uniref:YTH domain-containing family protein n=1 Tax=Macleaya cordata TaxID=56857 RepID=A0A200R1V0_MACCD|nr:YTH domain [Macleaya cordata]
MERCDGSEPGAAETYLIQGTELNPFIITTPPPDQIETMDNEGTPKFIFDQGLYYPAATYGYYCTGFESPGEWDDHHRFFGLDGQDFHYAGLQTENLPYVYYTPTYGYAQSPYNPFNPYIPGAVIGADGSVVGTQPYYTGSTYQHPISSAAYYPLVLQPGTDGIPNSSLEPHSLNAGPSIISGPNGPGLKDNNTLGSVGMSKAPPRPAAGDVRAHPLDNGFSLSHSLAKRTEGSKSNGALTKQPAAVPSGISGGVTRSASPHIMQGQSATGSIQAADQFSLGVSSSFHSPIKVATASNGLPHFGSNGRGWGVVDKLRPRSHYGGIMKNGNGSPDLLGEQNRGPRTNRSKNQWASSNSVEAHSTNAGATTIAQGNITIRTDQYNKEDFSVNYADAKFFVIKSYSEDDVHKSIKYNVWSSTPNGNKRLDNAYEDAQKIAAGKPRGCPVFLFFSVNASGQFCGVAEMIGPVDFNKDMDFWQQDKWSGSFPVKWHMIKDVPNTNFRHIILENNENKPVTNSRDTQEIKHKQGVEMLTIFKNYILKTSILDDFMYYEERQKIMQEEKKRLLGKSYDGSLFVPAFVPPTEPNGMVDKRPILSDIPKHNVSNNSGKMATSSKERVPSKPDVTYSSSGKDKVENVVGDENDVTSVLKIGSLTIDPKQSVAKSSVAAVTVQDTEAVDVVTVGSMSVKVNGFAESSSSGVLTVGTIPIVPKALNVDK